MGIVGNQDTTKGLDDCFYTVIGFNFNLYHRVVIW